MTLLPRDLAREIESERKSSRLAVLEAVFDVPDPAFREPLTSRRERESDEECRLLIDHALAFLAEMRPGAPVGEVSPESLGQQFPGWSPGRRLGFLGRIKSEGPAPFRKDASRLLSDEDDPFVAAALIRTFSDCWSEADVARLTGFLGHERLVPRIAALEVLGRRFPAALAGFLPAFLVSDDPRQRILAVQTLFRIDPDEAVSHLEWMLLEGTPSDRAAALKCAFLLPPGLVKEILLKFTSAESDLELVKQAGLHFRINPDLEIPYRLWEIAERSSAQKNALLKDVIKGASQALAASKTLAEPLHTYQARLQDWIYRRAAARFVRECLLRLIRAEPGGRPELLATIVSRAKQPMILAAFREARETTEDESEKRELDAVLASLETVPGPVQVPKAFRELPPEEQIPAMAAWEPDSNPAARADLGFLIQAEGSPDKLRAAVLRNALRLGLDGFEAAARLHRKSADTGLAVASLEYMARFAFDEVMPFLGTYLKSPNPRLKVAALHILQREDSSQAISALLTMLGQPDPDARRSALACLLHVDFSLIREQLVRIMSEGKDDDLVVPCLNLFEANPDPENLFAFFRLETCLGTQFQPRLKKALRSCETHLEKSGRLSSEEIRRLLTTFPDRHAKVVAAGKKPPPAYSVRVLRTDAKRVSTLESISEGFGGTHPLQSRLALGTLVVMALFSLFVAFLQGEGTPVSRKAGRSLLPEPISIKASVEEFDLQSRQLTVRGQDGTVFRLALSGNRTEIPSKGSRIRVHLKPHQMTSDGVVLGTLLVFSPEQ